MALLLDLEKNVFVFSAGKYFEVATFPTVNE